MTTLVMVRGLMIMVVVIMMMEIMTLMITIMTTVMAMSHGNNSDNVNDKNTEEKMIKQEKRKNNLCRLLRAAYNLALKLAPHVSP